MKSPRWRRPWCALALLLAGAAQAHIKLLSPTEWVVTGPGGDPQKLGPCGITPGYPGVEYVDGGTTVEAGSLLTVVWAETLLHPGHFRLAITADRSLLLDPAVTYASNGYCDTAAVQRPPVPPIIVDGLYEHVAPSPDAGIWTATIRVPDAPCERCTLQLVQFMSQHPPGCFYYHCAELRIVPRASDGGTPGDAGTEADAGTDAGATADAGTAADAGTTGDAGATPGPPGGPGCGCQGAGVADLAALLPVLALAWRRRRPRRALKKALRA